MTKQKLEVFWNFNQEFSTLKGDQSGSMYEQRTLTQSVMVLEQKKMILISKF